MGPRHLKIDSPAELLALIPNQLGFRPRDSVVVVAVRPDRLVGVIARTDAATVTDAGQRAVLLDQLARAGGAAELVVVVYADPVPAQVAAGVDALTAEADEHGTPVRETWVVGHDRYHPAGDPDASRPLTDLQSTVVAAEMVHDGVVVAADRSALGVIPKASGSAVAAATRAASNWAGSPQEAVHLFQRLRDRDAARRPSDLGRLREAMTDVVVRDAVLLSMLDGGDDLAQRLADGRYGDARQISTILEPGGPRPGDNARRTQDVLTAVVAHTRDDADAVPALTLLAFAAWWSGDGARAAVLVDRALGPAPDYRLAVLIDEILTNAMPPGWARR